MQEEVIFQTSLAEFRIMRREIMLLYIKRGLMPRFSKKTWVVLGISCVSVLGTVAGQANPFKAVLLWFLPLLFILWLVYFLSCVGIGVLHLRGMKKNYRQNRLFFLSKLFVEQAGDRLVEIPYDCVKSVRQCRDCFLIRLNNDHFYIIGKDDFRGRNSSEFIAFLERAGEESRKSRMYDPVNAAAGMSEESEVKYAVRTEVTQDIFEMATILGICWNARKGGAERSMGAKIAVWVFTVILMGSVFLGVLRGMNIRDMAVSGFVTAGCIVAVGIFIWKNRTEKGEGKIYDEKYLTQARSYYKNYRTQGLFDQPWEYVFCDDYFRMKKRGMTVVCHYWEVKELYESRQCLFFLVANEIDMVHKQDLADSVEDFKTFLTQRCQICQWQQISG